MDWKDLSLGSILSLPDKPSKSVRIACTGDRCCNGTLLHPDAYRHPAVIIDCDSNSVDVLKITSRRPEERFAYNYLKILGPSAQIKLGGSDDLLLERGAMDHDSYINLQHSYNVPISSLKVFRDSGPKLSTRSFSLLKRRLRNLERPSSFQQDRRVSDNQISPIQPKETNNGDSSGQTFTRVRSKFLKLVRSSIDGANLVANEGAWKPKPGTWGPKPDT